MISRINSAAQIGRLNRVVRRKEAGEFSPTDIAGCKLWLDFADADTLFTDAGSTKVTTDGDLIYQVNDKSGNGNHIHQPTAGDRPEYKTGTKNGLNSVYFSGGTEERLYNISAFKHNFPLSFIFIFTFEGGSGANVHFDFGRNRLSPRGGYQIYSGAYLSSGGTFSGNIVSVVLDTTSQFYINGETKNSGNAGTNGANGICIGNRYPGETSPTKGHYFEVLLYSGALSSADRETVEAYLNNKWDIY